MQHSHLQQAACEGLMAGAKEISPDASVAEISETELDIISTLKKEAGGLDRIAASHRA